MKKVVISLRHAHENNPIDYSAAIIYWYGVLDRLGYDVKYYDYNHYSFDDLKQTIIDFKADYFIHINYLIGVHTEFNELKDLCKVILLSSDAYRFHDSNLKHWIPYVDDIITFEGVKEWYLRDGLKEESFHKMKWGFNPNTMCTGNFDKIHNIQHYGGMHGDRPSKINKFLDLGEKVHIEGFLTHEEMKQSVAKSKYSLCFSANAINTRSELKGRVIEIPSKSVLLTENAPELETYYDEDEMILFSSVEDAVDKIKYYNNNDKEYSKLLLKGQKALWNKNTAYHEWNKILPNIDPDFKVVDPIKIIKEYHSKHYNQLT